MGAKKRSAAEDVAAKEQREQTAKALERKMDAMRKGAGIPTTEEYEAARANPPPPEERRLVLGLSCALLMTIASRASNTMSEILAKDGESETLRTGSYGFLFMNLAGGLGAITFLVRPGSLRWVYVSTDEAMGSMGSCLIALSLQMIAGIPDRWKVWTGDEDELPRAIVTGAAIAHLVIKNTKNAWMQYFVHMIAHLSMAVMVNLAVGSGDTKLLAGAILHGGAFLLKGEGSLQSACRFHRELGPEELSTMLLAISCWMISDSLIERYAKGSGLY